jgi:hypothetical protein
MRSRRIPVSSGLVGLFIVGAAGGHAQQGTPASGPATPPSLVAAAASPTVLERFNGGWDYNPQDSINAATGRPEQNPRSATQRTPGGTGGRGSGGGSGGGGGTSAPLPPQPQGGAAPPSRMPGDPMSADPNAYRRGGGTFGPNPLVLAEQRTLVRDLMEVNEKLTIKVASESVVFTDDLGRSRTYPTDGKKYKYRLAAAAYEARVYWDGAQLKKEIEGAYGFRMRETYFLGDDGQRLFVIIRIGDQHKKPPPPVSGANRVYDRIEESTRGTTGPAGRRP